MNKLLTVLQGRTHQDGAIIALSPIGRMHISNTDSGVNEYKLCLRNKTATFGKLKVVENANLINKSHDRPFRDFVVGGINPHLTDDSTPILIENIWQAVEEYTPHIAAYIQKKEQARTHNQGVEDKAQKITGKIRFTRPSAPPPAQAPRRGKTYTTRVLSSSQVTTTPASTPLQVETGELQLEKPVAQAVKAAAEHHMVPTQALSPRKKIALENPVTKAAAETKITSPRPPPQEQETGNKSLLQAAPQPALQGSAQELGNQSLLQQPLPGGHPQTMPPFQWPFSTFSQYPMYPQPQGMYPVPHLPSMRMPFGPAPGGHETQPTNNATKEEPRKKNKKDKIDKVLQVLGKVLGEEEGDSD